MVRYWHYKCNAVDPGPSGYWGDWETMVFTAKGTVEWGGDYSTRSPEVSNYLNFDMRVGDVVVCYQTDRKVVVGLCKIMKITGPFRNRVLWLKPIVKFPQPLRIHDVKYGTRLTRPPAKAAINGPVMARELSKKDVDLILKLAGVQTKV